MQQKVMCVAFGLVLAFAFTGCRSHEAKVADLQKQYDQLAKQYQQDCSGEYLEVSPKVSPKCKDEETKMNEAWKRLQTERARK